MKDLDFNSRTHVEGEGDPLMMVHGLAGPEVLRPAAELLASHFRVYLPTLPGFDASDGRVPYSDGLYTQFIADVANHFGLSDVTALGFSTGGRAVLNTTIDHDNLLRRAVVVDPVGMNTISLLYLWPLKVFAGASTRLQLGHRRTIDRQVSDEFADANHPMASFAVDEMTRLASDRTVRANIADIQTQTGARSYRWTAELRTTRTPTLILWGANDITCPAFYADELHHMLQQSTLVKLQGMRHLSMLEQPEKYTDHVLRFVEFDVAA
jgi:pimeloyl-ACP methyl ester carboxylesterase